MNLTKFFTTDYVDQASYDNLRKIASLVDGQKNASRKILYTILEKNIRQEIKVSQLGSKVAEFAEYLHGSMDGVIVGLAQNYIGTNNIPLLVREGNFGTRFSQEASAPRYIYTHGEEAFFKLFNKQDSAILKHQFFEGSQIEPMFYLPSLPLLLINGSEGVSSGFAQKILPRNPKVVKDYIKSSFKKNQHVPELIPYYEGFKGTIERGENSSQWVIKGSIKKLGVNKIEITEVPVGYDLKGYLSVLDDLEDKKVIQSYKDKCENDKFLFEVTIPSKSLSVWDEETLLTKLKLIKKVSENYTVIDENNKIKVFDSAEEIMQEYIRIKLEYLQKRKDYLVDKLNDDIRFDFSKYLFIKMIVNDELVINKRKKDAIVKDLDKVDNILKREDSYDYLLNMSIGSLTKERMDKLQQDIKDKKAELDKLSKTTIEEIWLSEI